MKTIKFENWVTGLPCDGCNSDDAKIMLDPYELEINNREIEIRLCDECLERLEEEI